MMIDTRYLLVFTVVALVGGPAGVHGQTPQSTKKLIEFGWDEPDTAFLRKHIREMEKTPFDGTVFHAPGEFLWHGWSKRAFSERDLAGAFDDVKNTPIQRLKHNFLRFNTAPGDVDWFDDFSAVVGNTRLAAKLARTAQAAGILFDIEQYNSPLFNYAKQRDAKTKSWDEYSAKTKDRGREVMTAFQQEFPDLVVLMTWSYSLPFQQAKGDLARLPQADYGLLKPFLDGMFEAARGKTKIVDGFESSYGYKSPAQFDVARTVVKERIQHFIPAPDRYRGHMSLGFGLWMDYDWRRRGWDEMDASKNYFTPAQFEASVRKAIDTSDEYVWIYTEKPRWWTPPDGKPASLPIEYDRALRRAVGRD